MDKIKKFDLMEKITHELEDLKNSQQAIIKKLAQIEVDNIELGNKKLDSDLPEMHQRVSENLESIAAILENFAGQKEAFGDKNNIADLKAQDALNQR